MYLPWGGRSSFYTLYTMKSHSDRRWMGIDIDLLGRCDSQHHFDECIYVDSPVLNRATPFYLLMLFFTWIRHLHLYQAFNTCAGCWKVIYTRTAKTLF